MKRKIYIFGIIMLFTSSLFAQQKQTVNYKPFPYTNPVIRHMYTADPAPHVFPDGMVWMVTSVDDENGGGFSTMHCYHTFSSADMVNWVDHGEILNLNDVLMGKPEPPKESWMLWAPDMIYHNGKYYLYFPIRIIKRNKRMPNGKPEVVAYTAVAVSDVPDKRFKIINPKIEGTSGIDPAIFIDDNDEAYLYWGEHEAAKLKENMTELAQEPIKLELNNDDFVEASWMHKRKGLYYFSWHSRSQRPIDFNNPDNPNRKKSTLDYGFGYNPLGPFQFGGVFNYELGVGIKNGPKLPGHDYVPWRSQLSNHGGIVEYHGQEYLFYHTAALSSWKQDEFKGDGTNTQRSVCIDYLNYNEDGSIIPVVQTLDGVKPVNVKQAFEIPVDLNSVEVLSGAKVKNEQLFIKEGEGTIMIKDLDLGTGYYFFGLSTLKNTEQSKVRIYLDSKNGLLCGTISLNKGSLDQSDYIADTFLRGANGVHNVYLVFECDQKNGMIIKDLRFFAGAPKVI